MSMFIKKFLDFFFEEEKETNQAQLETLYILATKVYINLYGHTKKEAEQMALKTVSNWVETDKVNKALTLLWKGKIA